MPLTSLLSSPLPHYFHGLPFTVITRLFTPFLQVLKRPIVGQEECEVRRTHPVCEVDRLKNESLEVAPHSGSMSRKCSSYISWNRLRGKSICIPLVLHVSLTPSAAKVRRRHIIHRPACIVRTHSVVTYACFMMIRFELRGKALRLVCSSWYLWVGYDPAKRGHIVAATFLRAARTHVKRFSCPTRMLHACVQNESHLRNMVMSAMLLLRRDVQIMWLWFAWPDKELSKLERRR